MVRALQDFDITIVIPTFNREATLAKAIASCLQKNLNIEILVIDDGSTDNTRSIVENLRLPDREDNSNFCIRYVFQKNRGVSAARNRGLELAKGRYLKFLDSDDQLIAGSLCQELQAAETSLCDVVVTGWRNDFYSDPCMKNLDHSSLVDTPPMEKGIDDMLTGSSPWTAAALYRKSKVTQYKWDIRFDKAEEWLWAWTLCLDDINFKNLEITSAIWNHYPSNSRLTSIGNPFDRSSEARIKILSQVYTVLQSKSRLNTSRRDKLSHYMHLDAIWAARSSYADWKKLSDNILTLNPQFKPDRETQKVLYLISRLLRYRYGVYMYSIVTKFIARWTN